MMKYKYLIPLLMILMALNAARAQKPGTFCLTNNELALWEKINNYRLKFALDPLPLSKSLSYVAYLHVRDLYLNHPDEGDCNLHSWSENGTWKPICYPEEQSRKNSAWNKPNEITAYNGRAMEITYYENADVMPDNIFDMWKMSSASASVMVNTGKWDRYEWKAVGVAVYKGYAVAWFGNAEDAYDGISICNSDSVIYNQSATKAKQSAAVEGQVPVLVSPKGNYHLIFGSFDNQTQAKMKAESYKSQGYDNVSIIAADNRYRISIEHYPTEEAADKAKDNLSKDFAGIWVLEF